MKTPGADHPITVQPHHRRVRVRFNGRTVADTVSALILREASYPPVLYIPRADADMAVFERTEHATHCPYKGQAAYYTLVVDGRRSENAVWSYKEPFEAVKAIAGHLAFYPDRVDGIDESDV